MEKTSLIKTINKQKKKLNSTFLELETFFDTGKALHESNNDEDRIGTTITSISNNAGPKVIKTIDTTAGPRMPYKLGGEEAMIKNAGIASGAGYSVLKDDSSKTQQFGSRRGILKSI